MLALECRQHNLFDRSRKILLNNRHLRQVTDFATLQAIAEFDTARLGLEQAGDSTEERRLAGSVTADDAEVILNVHFVVQITDQVLASIAEGQLAAFYQRD